jgi:hypothetical protein
MLDSIRQPALNFVVKPTNGTRSSDLANLGQSAALRVR